MRHIKTYGQLFEAEKKYDYACAMVGFAMPLMELFHSVVDLNDLNPEGKGLEKESHTTLLYGLHEDVDQEAVFDIINSVAPGDIVLGPVSLFENEKYDILKFDAAGEWLNEINSKLVKLPHTSDFPDYHPHATLAYLLPGTGKKYVDMFAGLSYTVKPTEFIYSMPDGSKIIHSIDANQD